MCMGSGPSTPPPPPIPPVLPEAPDASKRETVAKNTDDDKRKRAGQAGTILTGSRGLTDGVGTDKRDVKTMLGA
jgi:hypothetical protein